ncbi:TrgA family protein [Psychromarinibacter sp. C21-152]|uniref:TrgA family protein n=1 Tax=Psychromarinibacter sediminicola TaxID=3033385 RepID=A0AAE3NR78_9RHOB|nr:TrgA family protein [Psychromarinibacter sediminicola]MDF0602023.1 TrgA family protein [Psychromarinibacter sediminicola]
MPTAAKLVSAVLLAALAWYVGHLIIPYFPEQTPAGVFREVLAVLGLIIGWRFVGRHAGQGVVASVGYGLGGAAFLAFWGIVWFAGYEMFMRSINMSYGGPMEALKDMVAIGIGYFDYLKPTEIWGTLAGGGVVQGFLAEMTARRLP